VTLPRIGVFDSGVGGLTVLRTMAENHPAHYLYFGDTARLPYGTKSADTVARYAIGATRFLETLDIDLLVIACNTATALALPQIKQAAQVPVIGVVEPGAAMAAEVSRNRSAIVIATEATVSSHAYRDALQLRGLKAFEKACPLFVPLVEEGWIDHPVTEQVARIYLGEAMAESSDTADVLVLACTHYPLIAPLLRRITPTTTKIVDSAESTARVVRELLQTDRSSGVILSGATEGSAVEGPALNLPKGSLPKRRTLPSGGPLDHRTFRFFVTDSTDKFKRLATRFLGRQVDHVEHVDLGG
jgi:glutamate racemase